MNGAHECSSGVCLRWRSGARPSSWHEASERTRTGSPRTQPCWGQAHGRSLYGGMVRGLLRGLTRCSRLVEKAVGKDVFAELWGWSACRLFHEPSVWLLRCGSDQVSILPMTFDEVPRCPSPELVPGLREVAAALRRVRRRAELGPGFSLGICNPDRHLLAVAVLSASSQVERFSSQMSELGYTEFVGGAPEEMHQCHVIYVPDRQHSPPAVAQPKLVSGGYLGRPKSGSGINHSTE